MTSQGSINGFFAKFQIIIKNVRFLSTVIIIYQSFKAFENYMSDINENSQVKV